MKKWKNSKEMGKEDAPFTMTDGEHELDMVYVFVCWGGIILIQNSSLGTQPNSLSLCSIKIALTFIVYIFLQYL